MMGKRHLFLLAALGALVLLRGVFLSSWVPEWQAPDEPGHYEYGRLVARLGPGVDQSTRDESLQREILEALLRADFWSAVRADTPDPLPRRLSDDRFLARSGPQIGDEGPAYYWLLARFWQMSASNGASGGLLVGRLLSTSLLALTVLAAGLAARVGWPEDDRLAWGLPAFVALQPMAAFMGSALNNDSLALLLGACGFTAGLSIVQRGNSRRRVGLLALVTATSLLVKKTTLFLWPLALVAVLFSCRVGARQVQLLAGRVADRRGLALVFAALVFGLGIWLSLPLENRAAGWIAGGWDGSGSRWLDEGRSGLALDDRSVSERALLEQTVTPLTAGSSRADPLELAGEVRALTGAVEVSLRLDDGISASEKVCTATADWQPCELLAPPPTGGRLRVVLAVGAKGNTGALGQVQWQGLRLVEVDNPDDNLLRDADGRMPASRAMPLLRWGERVLRAPRGWAMALTRPEVWSTGALLRYAMFLVLLAGSFWGNFGWLQAPLPWPLLSWLSVLGVAGAAGSAYRLMTGNGRRDAGTLIGGTGQSRRRWEGSLLFAVCAVTLIALQTALPMIGFSWQPQGRYLLPGLLPIGVVMLLGCRSLLPTRWKGASEWALLGSLLVANVAMLWVIERRW